MELLANTQHPHGWQLERAIFLEETPDAGAGVCLQGVRPGPRMKSSAGFTVRPIPMNRELTFTCMLRGTRSGQTVRVNVYAWNSRSKTCMESTSLVSLDHHSWIPFTGTYVAPDDTVMLAIWIINYSAQSAYTAKPSLMLGAPSRGEPVRNISYWTPPAPELSKVIEVSYKACVRALKKDDQGFVTFPIPGPYKDQIALTFDVETKPKAALLDYRIRRREDGTNWLAEVHVHPPKEGTIISWKSLVFIKGSKHKELPKATAGESLLTNPWLMSTKCVQSDDIAIKEKAQELAKLGDDLETYARNVIAFTSNNCGTGKKFDSLDAKTALGCGGSCTSRANLAAALLRAKGVPARTVSHLPSWSRSKLFEHWLVEYWHPGAGWIWIEPTLNQFQPEPNKAVVLSVSNTSDEELCDDALHLRYLMPGAAYLSGCELSEQLVMALLMPNVARSNIAIEQSLIEGTPTECKALYDAALQNFENNICQKGLVAQSRTRTETIKSAVYEGNAKRLMTLFKSN